MSVASLPSEASIRLHWPAGDRLADAALAVVVFLGGFVLFEPAPYDLLMVGLIAVWAMIGLRLNRYMLPLILLLIVYLVGGLVAMTQAEVIDRIPMYIAITAFLAGSAIFFAAVISDAPERRFRVIQNAYIASAIVVALIGIAAYFDLFPGAETLKMAGRSKGTFQDPNVFGPYLSLPALILARRILTNRISVVLWDAFWFGILAAGIFLSFSRAAWGLAALAMVVVAVLTFAAQRDIRDRMRVIAYASALTVLLVALLAVALSVPAISDLFAQRANLVQYYDGGHGGRFDRILIGFTELVPQHPLGLGAFEFARIFGNDEHDMWLKGFTAYGWAGGIAYIVLVLWTLAAAFPLLFRNRPWQPLVQATYAVFVGHLLIHAVIDSDHWRHLFLIYGLLWGAIAAEKLAAREAATRAARPVRQPPARTSRRPDVIERAPVPGR